MKKPFNQTKVGKFLTKPAIKGFIKAIPFGVGSMAGHILDETGKSEAGHIDKDSIYIDLIKLAIYGILVYLLLKGNITLEEAETAKEFISD